MATFYGTFTCSPLVSTLYFRVRYRLSGESIWSSFNIATSGTTFTISNLDNNLIYDVQVTNVNGDNNPTSAIMQQVWITDPDPILSPTNSSLGYQFSNLSYDIDTYTATIALYESPGVIIATHVLAAGPYPGTVTDQFNGLAPQTQYVLNITPAANQFTRTFTYIFTTEAVASCAAPQNTTAVLT